MPAVVQRLREIGTVIYLQLPFETILRRIDDAERRRRPLFQDIEQARTLFRTRETMYERQADLIVDASQPPERIVRTILDRLASDG